MRSDVESQSNSALMEILTLNMHSLELAQDDSQSIQNLALDLAPALALNPNSPVSYCLSATPICAPCVNYVLLFCIASECYTLTKACELPHNVVT